MVETVNPYAPPNPEEPDEKKRRPPVNPLLQDLDANAAQAFTNIARNSHVRSGRPAWMAYFSHDSIFAGVVTILFGSLLFAGGAYLMFFTRLIYGLPFMLVYLGSVIVMRGVYCIFAGVSPWEVPRHVETICWCAGMLIAVFVVVVLPLASFS